MKARRLQLGVARPLVPPPHPGPPPAPPADELRRLYLDEGMPSEMIARHYRAWPLLCGGGPSHPCERPLRGSRWSPVELTEAPRNRCAA